MPLYSSVTNVSSFTRRNGTGAGGGGGASFPTPYIDWRPSTGNATRGMVPNSSQSVALPNNAVRFVKGVNLTGFGLVSGNGATITVAAAAGPEGQTTAFRSVSTNTTGLTQITNVRLPAGTFTVSMEAKAHDGASTYNNEAFGWATSTALISIGPSYQTKSRTFTLASPTSQALFLPYRNTTGDAYDINIDNIRVHAGAADLGIDTTTGKALQFGVSDADASNPTFSDKTFGRQIAIANLDETKTFTEITVIAAFNQAGDTAGTPVPFVCGPNYNNLNFNSQSNKLSMRLGGASSSPQYSYCKGAGWMFGGWRVKAGQQQILKDSCLLAPFTTASFSQAAAYLFHQYNGGVGGSVLPSGDKAGMIRIWDTFLTDAEYLAALQDMRALMIADGLTPAGAQPVTLIGLGDSISQAGGSFLRQYIEATPTLAADFEPIIGSGIAYFETALALREAHIAMYVADGGIPIYQALIGANDGTTIGTQGYFDDMVAKYARIRAAGGKVVANTILPSSSGTFNTNRALFNTRLRDNPQHYDLLMDWDTTTMGADADALDVAKYSDGVHPTAAGQNTLFAYFQPRLDAYIATL